MMKNEESFYKIGDAARLTGTRASQLRFYERFGLLSPEFRDNTSEYRFYSYDQLVEIETIISLQELGFKLKQIKTMLSDRDIFLEQSCFLSREHINEIDETIEKLTSQRERMETFNKLCSTFLSEYRLNTYTIESIPKYSVVLTGRRVRLNIESDAKEMLATMNLMPSSSPAEDWYMSVYTYKVDLDETDLADMQAELCIILSEDLAKATVEEPTRLYAKTTQAIRVDEIPLHIEKLIQLIHQAGLTPMNYYYTLLVAKDKSGDDRHIRQIRVPIESIPY